MRNELTIIQDRAEVAELLKKGYRTAGRIATVMNANRENPISPAQVLYDINAIKREYKESTTEDYSVARKEMIDRLFNLMTIAHEGYEQSKRPKVTVERSEVLAQDDYERLVADGVVDADQQVLMDAKIREESRPEGNHSFIQQIIQIEDKIAKIIGIDAPSKIALTDGEGNDVESPLGDLMQELNKKQLSE